MKKQILTLTFSAILGTMIIYGLIKFESFIYQYQNPEYRDMASELAGLVFTDLAMVLLFFIFVFPYQFIVIKPLKKILRNKAFSTFKSNAILFSFSTLIYALGFMIVFRSPYLGVIDTFHTFALGLLIFGFYFLINLTVINYLSKNHN